MQTQNPAGDAWMTSGEGHPRRWAILGVLVVSLLIVVLDNTVLNIALPTIQRDLEAGTLTETEAQEIIARNFYRPRLPEVLAKNSASFASVKTFEVDALFGGAAAAQKEFFDNGAIFDQIQAELAATR